MELTLNLGPCTACCGGKVCTQYYYIWRAKFVDAPGTPWDRGGVLIADLSSQPANVLNRWYQPYGTYGAWGQVAPYEWTSQVIQYNNGTWLYQPSVWQFPGVISAFGNYNSQVNVNGNGINFGLVEMIRQDCPNFCYGCFSTGTSS